MMDYGYDGGGGWMWGYGGWLMLVTLALVGLVIWWAVTVANRPHYSPIVDGPRPAGPDVTGRDRTRQLLDDRYARAELSTDEYTERLRNLGF